MRHNARSSKLPFVVILLVFAFLVFYVYPPNINGDGKMHTLYAKEIAETGHLLQHDPYSLLPDGEQDIHLPVNYPLTPHVLMSFFYMAGGEEGLKLFSPLFGMLVALAVYLILRRVNVKWALAAAVAVVAMNLLRFLMVPLIEQMLLFGMLITIYFYHAYVKTGNTRYGILAGLFLGLVLFTKQQGLIFCAVLLGHLLVMLAYRRLRFADWSLVKGAASLVIVALIVSVVPLLDQADRNGVLIEEGSLTVPPGAQPAVPIDHDAYQEVLAIIGYNVEYNGFHEAIAAYLIHPYAYSNALSLLRDRPLLGTCLALLTFAFVALGTYMLIRRDRLLAGLLLVFLGVEVIITYLADTRPFQYHNLGIAILAMLMVLGMGFASKASSSRGKTLALSGVRGLVIIGMVGGFAGSVLIPNWNNSGRSTDEYLAAYRQVGEYVAASVPRDAIFLTGGGTGQLFGFYAGRPTVWVSEWGGTRIPELLNTEDSAHALELLRHYGVDYLFIDHRQFGYSGLSDYFPGDGLAATLTDSDSFSLMLDVQGKLTIWKIEYSDHV